MSIRDTGSNSPMLGTGCTSGWDTGLHDPSVCRVQVHNVRAHVIMTLCMPCHKASEKYSVPLYDTVTCVRARYTLCHDMCHDIVCMMDSISNLLLIVDY